MIDIAKVEYQRSKNGKKAWFGYREFADMIIAEQSRAPASDIETAALKWLAESRALHSVAYPDSEPVTDPRTRKYCKVLDKTTDKIVRGSYDRTQLPTLDDAYIQKALPVVKSQILKGGLRLAKLLNTIAEQITPALTPDPNAEKSLLDAVSLKNKIAPAN